jgi:hypothetical protein
MLPRVRAPFNAASFGVLVHFEMNQYQLWARALTPMDVARVGRVLWLVHLRRETFDVSVASIEAGWGRSFEFACGQASVIRRNCSAPAAAEARPRTVSITTMAFQFRQHVSPRDGGMRGTQHHLHPRFEAPQGGGMEL